MDHFEKLIAAAGMANAKPGRPRTNEPRDDDVVVDPTPRMTVKEVAAHFGISGREIERMQAILRFGAPELLQAVKDQKVSMSDAAYIAYMEPKDQLDMIEAVKRGKFKRIRFDIIAIRRQKIPSGL